MNIVFAEGITIEELNPHNFALKNEYMDNLFSSAFMVLPKVRAIIGNEKRIIIIRGFLSNAYMLDNMDKVTKDMDKLGKGLAFEITWEDFNFDDANLIARSVYDYVTQEGIKMKVIIKLHKNSIFFIRDVYRCQIVEQNNSEFRIVKKE